MFRPPSWPQIESNDKNFAEGGVLPSRLRVSSAILYACDAVPRPYGRRGKVMNSVHLAVQAVAAPAAAIPAGTAAPTLVPVAARAEVAVRPARAEVAVRPARRTPVARGPEVRAAADAAAAAAVDRVPAAAAAAARAACLAACVAAAAAAAAARVAAAAAAAALGVAAAAAAAAALVVAAAAAARVRSG